MLKNYGKIIDYEIIKNGGKFKRNLNDVGNFRNDGKSILRNKRKLSDIGNSENDGKFESSLN